MKKHLWLGSLAMMIVFGGATCQKPTIPTAPSPTPSTTTPETPVTRRYLGNGPDICARIRFTCATNEHYFSDAGGCGCELNDTTPPTQTPPKDETFCTMEYNPVCGEKTVYCIRAPCPPIKQTYGNRCEAEKDDAKNIVRGACPENQK